MSYALKVNGALIVDSWAMVVMVSLILTAGTCFLMCSVTRSQPVVSAMAFR